jgi:cephalosporin hydroxylase
LKSIIVILDSCHSKEHVLKELEAYSPLVTTGSYIIATDGIMKDLCDVPNGDPAGQATIRWRPRSSSPPGGPMVNI